VGESVQPQIPNVELRLSELQTQIDSLSVALQQWRRMQEHTQPMEQRLAQLTEQCARIVESWRETDVRHTEVVTGLEARLGEWGAIEQRLQHDSGERIRELERTIEHEWQTLRQIHEEPAKQLREQAATLGETCVAAANLALRGFERAESRFAALEQDLQGRMAELSRDVQTAVAQLQTSAGVRPPLPGSVPAFPLESVMRIHEGLRESDDGVTSGALGSVADTTPPSPAKLQPLLPEAAASLSARMESLERAVGEARVAAADGSAAWWLMHPAGAVLVVLAVALAGAGAFAFWMQHRVEASLNDAAARVAAADRRRDVEADAAEKRLAATHQEADRHVAEARQTAVQAQVVGNVLAAPDLVRFSLTGTDAASRAYAQVLWSRSRGLVLSASRLPPAPASRVYQFWLLTTALPVSAGLLTLDQAGRATLATDLPPNVPRPVTGAAVTLEPLGGSAQPSGVTVLSRIR
jgi:Anti-sigma-K factor rskA, C-terminal